MESRDGYVWFTLAGELAKCRTDAHADGSTFVSRKAAVSGFAANPTRTSFANAIKPTEIIESRLLAHFLRGRAQISLYDRQIS
jgi:hypothetical protein